MGLTCDCGCSIIEGERVTIRKEEYENLRLDHWLLDVLTKFVTRGGRELHEILANSHDYRDWLRVANPELYKDLERKNR